VSESPKKKTSPLFVIAVVVLLAALAVEGVLLAKRPALTDPSDQGARDAALAKSSKQVETFGEKSAPIKIEFYAIHVLEWHAKTIGLLREYDKQHPGRIYVELMPMGNSECDAEMISRGFACAVTFINGKHEFTLPNGKKVDLQKKPNTSDSFYNSEDVITVLDSLKG
jgi:hypothetical protein